MTWAHGNQKTQSEGKKFFLRAKSTSGFKNELMVFCFEIYYNHEWDENCPAVQSQLPSSIKLGFWGLEP